MDGSDILVIIYLQVSQQSNQDTEIAFQLQEDDS